MTRKTKNRSKINPRERLTKKARAAIELYANIKSERTGRLACFMIDHVLTAERMKRVDLYAWLESIGYRWKPPYWQIRDIDGRTVGGYCPKEQRPRKVGC